MTRSSASVPAVLGVPVPLWLQPVYFVYGAVMLVLSIRLWSHWPTEKHLPAPSVRACGSALLRAAIHPITALLVVGVSSSLFVLALHPWFMNWGSSQAERSTPLPGDVRGATTESWRMGTHTPRFEANDVRRGQDGDGSFT